MSDRTGIQWTEATWNPTRGCSRVSEGCRRCYAERLQPRLERGPEPVYVRITPAGPRWTGTVELIPSRLEIPLRWRRPRWIFVDSMSDLFHEALPDEALAQVFAVMARAPWHRFQVLTKRAARLRAWTATAGAPLEQVWLGVSVEDQAAADARVPDLLGARAAHRFLSCEPLLGPLDIHPWLARVARDVDFLEVSASDGSIDSCVRVHLAPRVDWVIAGGESGPEARPCHPDWVRSLRDQCAAAGVPFFFKQWGEWQPVRPLYGGDESLDDGRGELSALEPGGCLYSPRGPALQPAPGSWLMERVGKRAAGAELDGRSHREMP